VKQLKNTVMTTIKTFEAGNIYEMRFIGDSDLTVKYVCVKRTATTVTFERLKVTNWTNDVVKRKIKVWDGSEYVLAGSYSMAPSIYAKNIVG
jgi:hypothetical protein